MNNIVWTPSDFAAVLNQTLEYAYNSVEIEGEVAGFKINQAKFVFFDLKDELNSLACFMLLFQLRQPIQDGMRVRITARPQLSKRGKFSLIVAQVVPLGEGSIKEAARLLREKLTKEGLFDQNRKRILPSLPTRIGLISSEQAAGFADFCRILEERFGGVKILFKSVQVQGEAAADQIIQALSVLNQITPGLDLIALVRGGGSADDLACFNDERLVRAIAASRVPVVTGIGHEIDESLSDLVADVAAATPSHVAQLIVPDKTELLRQLGFRLNVLEKQVVGALTEQSSIAQSKIDQLTKLVQARIQNLAQSLIVKRQLLDSYDPYSILKRGYAILRGRVKLGELLEIENRNYIIKAEVKDVKSKKS